MSSDIETTALDELCEQVIDCPHSTPVWMDSGVIVLRSSNIRNGRLDLSNPSYTDEHHYQERSRRATVQAGDLVITREAPMGEVCLIPANLKCCLGQRMVMLRPDQARCDGKYLLYALQSRRVQNEIRSHEGTGSTVSNLRIPVLKALQIPNPNLANQKATAHILGTLDDKIELNRKTNETLEAMAKALFKSWFVDFDPVRAKAEGRSTGLPDEISELFPDSFEDSELGEIPSGWRIGTTGNAVGEVFDGPHATPKEASDGHVFLGIKNMTGSSLDLSEKRWIGLDDWDQWTKRVVPTSGDIVFTYEAALGLFAVIPSGLTCCLGRRMALIRPRGDLITQITPRAAARSPSLVHMHQLAHGTQRHSVPERSLAA
jgi:type I restriction enzyme S subunit